MAHIFYYFKEPLHKIYLKFKILGFYDYVIFIVLTLPAKSEEDNLYKPVRGSPTPPPEDDDYELTLLERWGAAFEYKMMRFFTRWGTICSKYPVPIIVLSVGLALGLSTGINWLEVRDD